MNTNKMSLIKFKVTNRFEESYLHDYRIKKPDYLTKMYFHNRYENVVSHDINHVRKMIEESNKKHLDNYHKRYGKKTKSKKKVKSNLTGLIGLSHQIVNDLENNIVTKEKLVELFFNAINEIVAEIRKDINPNFKCIYIVVHFDEKTPHAHFSCENFDDNCKSIFYQMLNTKHFLSWCQDVVGFVFSEIDYFRGEKRKRQNILKVREMHQIESKNCIAEIELFKNEIEKLKGDLDKINNELVQKKLEMNEIFFKINILKDKESEYLERNKDLAYKSLEELNNLIDYYKNELEEDLFLQR
jgi:hypothetical protein